MSQVEIADSARFRAGNVGAASYELLSCDDVNLLVRRDILGCSGGELLADSASRGSLMSDKIPWSGVAGEAASGNFLDQK